jgi:uncharacterized membrane protein (DUF2068 family)
LVASFEFTKGVFVLLIGLSALLLVHQDLWVIAESLLALFRISTDRHSAQVFLDFADNMTDSRLWTAAWIAFAYSALRFTEAYGLWRERVWAEWVAFISGTLFLPVEVDGLLRGITIWRSLIFVGNLGVVFFMFYLIRAGQQRRAQAAQAETSASQGT